MGSKDIQICTHCGGSLRRLLACDLRGAHVYIKKCVVCLREVGDYWTEVHWRPQFIVSGQSQTKAGSSGK